jgi:hypothetical protein
LNRDKQFKMLRLRVFWDMIWYDMIWYDAASLGDRFLALQRNMPASWAAWPEDRGSTNLWNVRYRSPIDTPMHPTGPDSSAALLWEPAMSQFRELLRTRHVHCRIIKHVFMLFNRIILLETVHSCNPFPTFSILIFFLPL